MRMQSNTLMAKNPKTCSRLLSVLVVLCCLLFFMACTNPWITAILPDRTEANKVLPLKTPNLELSPQQADLGKLVYGYTQQEAEAKANTITIKNTGTGAAIISGFNLSGTGASAFVLGGTSTISAINADSESTFTIQPAAGQAAGKYEAVITAAYGDGETVAANVSLEIELAEPVVSWPPDYTAYTGQTLAVLKLPQDNGSGTPGVFSWDEPTDTLIGEVGDRIHKMIFTPSNNNYKTVTKDIKVIVSEAPLVILVFDPINDVLKSWMPAMDYDPDTNTVIISRGHSITITLDGIYNGVTWMMNPGNSIINGDTFIYAFNDDYNQPETYTLTLLVWAEENNVPYNRTIWIKVMP